ncbi:MAG: cyclase family protein [Ignavibacteriales bacterium]|nr:MAG: cyclase family protein [Ignavibacteriales bacterium]
MKTNIILISILIVAFLFTGIDKSYTQNFSGKKLVDLTHEFSEESVFWPTAENFNIDTVFAGITEKGYYYSAYQFSLAEHGGTHFDAPVHFCEKGQSVEQIPVERLIGDAVMVDVSADALANRDYLISIEDFEKWEKVNGKIPEDAFVLVNTGYSRFYPDKEKYMGTSERGAEAVAKLHFPGLDPKAATWLAVVRKVNAFGLDTPSIDYGQSVYFETHRNLFKNGVIAFENLTNLDKLPAKGATVFAFPMKIKGGSGAPLRMVAMIP